MKAHSKAGYGSGWHNESHRHSLARKTGKAGGAYASTRIRRILHTHPEYKKLTFKKLRNKGIYLKYKSDSDHDGVTNVHDCRPLDKYKQDDGKNKLALQFDKKKLTEAEVKLMLRRINAGKMRPSDLNYPDYGWELTEEQSEKGRAWLMNQWKTPKGVERKNNPFGLREQRALETFHSINLIDFHPANHGNYVYPIYEVNAEEGSFQYYVSAGEIHIIG